MSNEIPINISFNGSCFAVTVGPYRHEQTFRMVETIPVEWVEEWVESGQGHAKVHKVTVEDLIACWEQHGGRGNEVPTSG
jgi:hypothetical protein